ncbi:MAG: hypothetical protein KDK38_16025, partial [Leptospiraceae bacterium]|nr:hypothetical protein [Leptospiraceae bacterium]
MPFEIITKKNLMKYIMISLLLSLVTLGGYTQTISISDEETGEPLEMVVLLCREFKSQISTNARGQADISAFKNAESIEIRTLGYEPMVVSYRDIEALNFNIRLKATILNMDEVVVSATRWKQVSNDVPSKVISISPKQVALQNPQTTADLLGNSGKVFIQKSQQGGGSPMIRG